MKKNLLHIILVLTFQCIAILNFATEWPNESNTGPSGTLTNHSGDITVTTNGQIIENLNVNGSIYIKADNVLVRNCKFGALNVSSSGTYTGTVVEDCELNWAGSAEFTLRRCEMSRASDDLIRVSGANILIEYCYLHIDGPEVAGTHCDVIQEYPEYTGTNLIVRNNTLHNANTQTSIVIGATDLLMENNLIAGAGYSIYGKGGQIIRNNRFSTLFYPNCGYFSVITGTPDEFTGNVWHETGQPIAYDNGGTVVMGVTIASTDFTLEAGQYTALQETVIPNTALNQNVSWSSSNTSVATVDANGVVNAVSEGTSTITVVTEDGGYSSSCVVTVVPWSGYTNIAQDKPISVSAYQDNTNGYFPGIYLVDGNTSDGSRWSAESFPQSATIDLGSQKDIEKVELFTYDSRAYQYLIEVSNDGTNFATLADHRANTLTEQPLSDDVNITGRYFRLTVTGASGYYGTWISINELRLLGEGGIVNVPVTGISLSSSNLDLSPGDTYDLDETVSPSNATNKNVTWASGNTSIATVDQNGLITAVTDGNVVISATTNDGGFTANCSVNITSGRQTSTQYEAEDYSGKSDCTIVTVWGGYTGNGYLNYGAVNSWAEWNSIDGGSGGTASITFRYANGSTNNRVCNVIVNGSTIGTVTLAPTGNWSTWDTESINVQLSAGTNTIRLLATTSAGGPNLDNLTIEISDSNIPVTGISLDQSSLSLQEGSTTTLMATVSPAEATDQSVIWSSGNTAIATISSTGVVTAISAGSTIITVTTNDGGYTATCNVTIESAGQQTSTQYEAESYSAKASDCYVKNINPGFTGSGFLDYGSNGSWAEWASVEGGNGGSATITFRYANGSTDNRICNVIVNGTTIGTGTFPGTGSWSTWQTESINVGLNSGMNTLKLQAITSAGGPNLDNLIVEVSVSTIPVTGISLNLSNIVLQPGESANLVETITPVDATDQSVSWSTGNAAIATVDANGIVSALNDGQTTITVTSNDGGFTAMCQVSVQSSQPITTQYEAESYSAKSSDCYFMTNNPGYTGSGFLDYGGNGSFAEWDDIDCGDAGTITLTVKYANGSTVNRSCNVIVNGTTVGSLTFAPTAAWSSWDTETISFSAPSGITTVKIQASTSNGGPNIDHLIVETNSGAKSLTKSSHGASAVNRQMLLYPNPCSVGLLNIILPETESNSAIRISVIDLNGRMIESKKYNNAENRLNLPTANLSKGVYLIQAVSERNTIQSKLVIK